jgi:hypothetical protein
VGTTETGQRAEETSQTVRRGSKDSAELRRRHETANRPVRHSGVGEKVETWAGDEVVGSGCSPSSAILANGVRVCVLRCRNVRRAWVGRVSWCWCFPITASREKLGGGFLKGP